MYLEAEKRFHQAKELKEKLAALEDMWALLTKHKGTEKMQADIKKKMSKLKAELEASKSSKKKGFTYTIPKEGAAQIPLIGLPNSGKSALVSMLTNAKTEVAEYAFTTRAPFPSMMPYLDIFFQLIDLPPFSPQFMESWIPDIVKRGDLFLILIDITSDDILEDIAFIKGKLQAYHLNLPGFVIPDAIAETLPELPVLILATKIDLSANNDMLELLREEVKPIRVLPFSIYDEETIEAFKKELYRTLHLIRVYSKIPGKKPDMNLPFVLQEGATLLDFAVSVHKDFMENLRYARVWGKTCFEGQQVAKDYLVQEGDVIELHI
jgi:uncharacterized protein